MFLVNTAATKDSDGKSAESTRVLWLIMYIVEPLHFFILHDSSHVVPKYMQVSLHCRHPS